jgi:hypothetical protein
VLGGSVVGIGGSVGGRGQRVRGLSSGSSDDGVV